MINIDELKFDEKGLIPAVVVDSVSKKVLTLAYTEIVATFLAVLELCKTNSVSLEDDASGENPNIKLLDETKGTQEVGVDGTN